MTKTTKTTFAAAPAEVGPLEAAARTALDGYLAAQADARDALVSLRQQLAGAVAERDELDAVIGTADETEDAFTRLGDADTRVTSLERRISQSEAAARRADFDAQSARITVEYRRGEDLVAYLEEFDRDAVDAEFLSRIQPLFDAYQDALQARDDAEDEARGIARRLAGTPGASVSVGEDFVQIGGTSVRTPAYQRRTNAGTVFERVIDRRADERRREIAAQQAEAAAERRAERERQRQQDLEFLALNGGGSADPSARVDGAGPGMPTVHPQFRGVTGLTRGGNDRHPNAF